MLPIAAATLAGLGFGYAFHDDIKKNVDYGSYLIPHKYYVYRAGSQLELPLSRTLKHDLSKFRPDEWSPYANWFNGPEGLHGTKNREVFLDWRKAVQKHYGRNEHHWRPKHLTPDQVSLDAKLESIADWYGVQRAKGDTKKNFKNWFEQKKDTFPIDKPTVQEAESRIFKNAARRVLKKSPTVVELFSPVPEGKKELGPLRSPGSELPMWTVQQSRDGK